MFFSPVDCIHWTSAAQLSLLEDEMRRVERVNVSCKTLFKINQYLKTVELTEFVFSF